MSRRDELRRNRRQRKRFAVRYWTDAGLEATGFTIDVSHTGLFVESVVEIDPGTRVHLEITLDDSPFFAEGIVARARPIHPGAKAVRKPGFGARFVSFEEAARGVPDAEPPTAPDAEPLRVDLRDPEELDRVYKRDLEVGALLVQTDRRPPIHAAVRIRLLLPEPQGAVLVAGSVTAVLEDLPGIGVQLDDPAPVQSLVRELLSYR